MLLKKSGVRLVEGTACFLSPGEVRVTGTAGDFVCTADEILIATGSRRRRPRFLDWRERGCLTATAFLIFPDFRRAS